MAQDNVGLKFNVLLLGAFAQRDKTFLIALLPVFKHSVELRALGGLGGRITATTKSLAFISLAIDRATSKACSACGDASNATSIL